MRYQKLMALVLLMALMAGCGGPGDQSESSGSEPESSASESGSQSLPEPDSSSESSPGQESSQPENVVTVGADLRKPGQLTIYTRYSGSQVFSTYTTEVTEPITLTDIADAVSAHISMDIPVLSITQQKGMVVVDLAGSFIEEYDKGQVEEALTALAATLQQNHVSFEWLQYRQDGTAGIFGEEFEIPPVKLIEGTREEFDAIRAQIPYEGLYQRWPPTDYIVEVDETGKALANYLSMLELTDREVSSLSQLDSERILYTAVNCTKYYSANPDSENYAPVLEPLVAPATELLGMHEDWFWLREHVEQTVSLLYGEVSYTHSDLGKYRYLETLGVYTPPHMGGGGTVIPVVFSYEDTGETIVAEVAYVVEGMGGYMNPGDWAEIAPDNLQQFVREKSTRYTVTAKKTPEGGFLLESQVLK